MISLFSFTGYSFIKLSNKSLRIKLSLASGLLITQILIGWIMIVTKLQPIVVASHLATGIAFFWNLDRNLDLFISTNEDV